MFRCSSGVGGATIGVLSCNNNIRLYRFGPVRTIWGTFSFFVLVLPIGTRIIGRTLFISPTLFGLGPNIGVCLGFGGTFGVLPYGDKCFFRRYTILTCSRALVDFSLTVGYNVCVRGVLVLTLARFFGNGNGSIQRFFVRGTRGFFSCSFHNGRSFKLVNWDVIQGVIRTFTNYFGGLVLGLIRPIAPYNEGKRGHVGVVGFYWVGGTIGGFFFVLRRVGFVSYGGGLSLFLLRFFCGLGFFVIGLTTQLNCGGGKVHTTSAIARNIVRVFTRLIVQLIGTQDVHGRGLHFTRDRRARCFYTHNLQL